MLTNKSIHTRTETLTMGPDITFIAAYRPSDDEQPLWQPRLRPELSAASEDGSAGATDELDEVEDDELDEDGDDEDADDDEEDEDDEEDDEDDDDEEDDEPGN